MKNPQPQQREQRKSLCVERKTCKHLIVWCVVVGLTAFYLSQKNLTNKAEAKYWWLTGDSNWQIGQISFEKI